MRLLLVRHGETQQNREGRVLGQGPNTLTDEGRRQAAAIARALSRESIAAIYSSPVKRAMETAQIIGDKLRLPVNIVSDLAEADVGALEGLLPAEMRASYPDFMELWHRDPGTAVMPGGESLNQVQQRAWRAVQSFLGDHPEATVVAVSHNFTIAMLICKALGLPPSSFHNVRADLGSISAVELREGRSQLVLLNDRCHLLD